MKKRKLLSHRIPAVLLALVLTGCGGANAGKGADGGEVVFENAAKEEETGLSSEESSGAATESSESAESEVVAAGSDEASLEATEEVVQEPEPDDPRIAEILGRMTTRQKVSQMIMPAIRTWGGFNLTVLNDEAADFISRNQFGGIILFSKNIESPEQTVKLTGDLQRASAEGGAGAGIFIAIDQEGGLVTRLTGGTNMPGNMALGATGDPEMARACSQVIGKELSACGFNLDFAPDSDVNDNPRNPIIGVRSFSDDPETVAEFSKGYIQGLHDEGVMAAVKHFPGHGNTETDSHTGFPTVEKSLEEIRSCELVPFRETAKTTDFVMTAHIRFPQVTGDKGETYSSAANGEEVILPATLSKTMITDILRGELGYNGVVITDSLEMEAVSRHFAPLDSAKLAINAGVDMLLMPVEIAGEAGALAMEKYIDDVAALAESGEIPMERLDESVTRILRLKSKYGLLEPWEEADPEAAAALAKETVGSSENADVEWEICKKAVTLVKNEGAVPVAEGQKVVIAYYGNSQKKYINAAVERLKEEGVISSSDNITIIRYKGRGAESAATDLSGAEVGIILSSTDNYKLSDTGSYTGSAADYIDAFITASRDSGAKSVVLSTSLPYDLFRFPDADALMACYSDRAVTAAIYAAFGGFEPTGRLPVDET